MAKAIGIGGLFLEFKGDKVELHKFYQKHLKLEMTDYGSGFLAGEQLMLLSFKRESDKTPLVNFRVDNVVEMMESLQKLNLETDDIVNYDYGKFAHFTDPFGNYIELWEPNIDMYKKMVRAEIEEYCQKARGARSQDSRPYRTTPY